MDLPEYSSFSMPLLISAYLFSPDGTAAASSAASVHAPSLLFRFFTDFIIGFLSLRAAVMYHFSVLGVVSCPAFGLCRTVSNNLVQSKAGSHMVAECFKHAVHMITDQEELIGILRIFIPRFFHQRVEILLSFFDVFGHVLVSKAGCHA